MCNINAIAGAGGGLSDLMSGNGSLKDVGKSDMGGELSGSLDIGGGLKGLLGSESDATAENGNAGEQSSSLNIGQGPNGLNLSGEASATAGADSESNAESTSGDQFTKDMEGTDSDYSMENLDASGAENIDDAGAEGEETGNPVDAEIDGVKEGITDGLMAMEELEPGFIQDIMVQVEAGANAEASADTADSAQGETVAGGDDALALQGESAAEGDDAVQGENAAEGADALQGEGAAEGDDVVQEEGTVDGEAPGGGNEDLMASLEELGAALEEIIGKLGGGETETPDGGEAVKAGEADSGSDTEVEEVAEGMAEELGDGEAPPAAESSPVDTFMEIFEQMSPDAQAEVVEILASGAFGEEGIEAADAVSDDATGEIDTTQVVDEAEAA